MNPILEIQLLGSVWGVRQVLEACRPLAPEQFAQPQGIGPDGGSLQAALGHIVGAMFYFADNFAGRPFNEAPGRECEGRTPDDLIALLERSDAALRESLEALLARTGDDPDANVVWSYSKRNVPLGAAIAQVLDHNTHHRVQCVHMLKKLGVAPLPKAYPLEWACARAHGNTGRPA